MNTEFDDLKIESVRLRDFGGSEVFISHPKGKVSDFEQMLWDGTPYYFKGENLLNLVDMKKISMIEFTFEVEELEEFL